MGKKIPKKLTRDEKRTNNFKIELIRLLRKYNFAGNVSGYYDLWNEIKKLEEFYTKK